LELKGTRADVMRQRTYDPKCGPDLMPADLSLNLPTTDHPCDPTCLHLAAFLRVAVLSSGRKFILCPCGEAWESGATNGQL
jgi:hypothetical protein